VELRPFAGLGRQQTAAGLAITVYQARQKWARARARLWAALRGWFFSEFRGAMGPVPLLVP
jgi:hypothetical protein